VHSVNFAAKLVHTTLVQSTVKLLHTKRKEKSMGITPTFFFFFFLLGVVFHCLRNFIFNHLYLFE
jgi:hypothetical protein